MKRGKLRTVLLLPDKPILIGCRKKLTSVSESIFRDDMQLHFFKIFFKKMKNFDHLGIANLISKHLCLHLLDELVKSRLLIGMKMNILYPT